MKNLLAKHVGMVPSPDGIILQVKLGPNKTKEEVEAWLGEEGALLGLVHAPAEIQLSNKKPEKKKGGPLSRWTAIRCKEKDFWDYLCSLKIMMHVGMNPEANEINAVKGIYNKYRISSRAQLDDPNYKAAADLFKAEVKDPYDDYLRSRG